MPDIKVTRVYTRRGYIIVDVEIDHPTGIFQTSIWGEGWEGGSHPPIRREDRRLLMDNGEWAPTITTTEIASLSLEDRSQIKFMSRLREINENVEEFQYIPIDRSLKPDLTQLSMGNPITDRILPTATKIYLQNLGRSSPRKKDDRLNIHRQMPIKAINVANVGVLHDVLGSIVGKKYDVINGIAIEVL